ncbi:MAG: hypothetical protein ABJF88_13570 [Rhodothermales bacterium]
MPDKILIHNILYDKPRLGEEGMTQSILHGNEQQIASTGYGTVTDRRVVFRSKKGWFSGGSQEDLPLKHITSVRMEINRHVLLGLLLLLGGFFAFNADQAFFGTLMIVIAVLLLWGSPRVVLNTAGSDLRPAIGFPWTRQEASTFVKAVQSQLFRD